MAGLRAGLDVSNYLGLRGFYWRGVTDKFDDTEPLRGYGGEAQFNLNAGTGLAPYLLVGAGQLKFADEFLDLDAAKRDDEQFLLLGGGIGIRLTDNFRLNAAARDHLISVVDARDTSTPDQIRHNWMFAAGLTFNLGRGRSRTESAPPMVADPPVQQVTAQPAQRAGQTVVVPPPSPPAVTVVTQAPAQQASGVVSDGRVVTIPVPERGELYIRWGEGGRMEVSNSAPARAVIGSGETVDMDRLVEAVARAVRDETGSLSEADIRRIVREEFDRMDIDTRVERAVVRELSDLPVTTRTTGSGDRPSDSTGSTQEPGTRARMRAPEFYAGVDFNSPSHFVVGGRVQVTRLRGFQALAFVPELALGLTGDGTGFMAVGNLEYRFRQVRLGSDFQIEPYARAGAGFLNIPNMDTQGVLNLTYGFASRLGSGRFAWFAEHQGIDFFNRNRIAVGLRVGN